MITVPVLSLALGAVLAYGAVGSAFFAWFGWRMGASAWQIAALAGMSALCSFALGVILGVPLMSSINFEWR